jgi:hypothetical protein
MTRKRGKLYKFSSKRWYLLAGNKKCHKGNQLVSERLTMLPDNEVSNLSSAEVRGMDIPAFHNGNRRSFNE